MTPVQPARRWLGITLWALCALLPVVGSGAHARSGDHVLSIAEARGLPLGTVVTVEGLVSTPSGAFESSHGDKGFGVQDSSAGIYVSLPIDIGVAPGRRATPRVRVLGTLTNSFGLLMLVPTDAAAVTRRGSGRRVRPEWAATGRVGKATEGRIIRVVGRITEGPASDLPYGFKLFIDDGSGKTQIFVNVQTGIDVRGLSVGDLVSVTGFSGQFETQAEVEPRRPEDITRPAR